MSISSNGIASTHISRLGNMIKLAIASTLAFGLTALCIFLYSKVAYLKGQVDYLQANQRVMIWQMDNSCFDQIKNNSDGILRLQVGEK